MSPAVPSTRRTVAVKLAQTGIDAIDLLAADAGVDRSEMIRRMLTYAVLRMPKGWKPATAPAPKETP